MSLLFNLKFEFEEGEFEAIQEIFLKYNQALSCIGVDFEDEIVSETIANFALGGGLESSFQAVIEYWYRKDKFLEYPNACLITALNEFWKPNRWQDKYLNYPDFKPQTQIWFEDKLKYLGRDFMNKYVADYGSDEYAREYVLLMDGTRINFKYLKNLDWVDFERFVISTPLEREELFRFAPV